MPKKEYHTGIVRDNDDPDKRCRLKIECPSIVAGDTLDWADPLFHWVDSSAEAGCVFIPNIDSQVDVEIESEEDSEVNSLEMKWRCSVYPIGTVPEEFQENYPERRGWKTKAGHLLYFDDTDGEHTFLYRHPSGTEIYVNDAGQIELKPTGNQSVLIGDGADEPIPLGNELRSFINDMISTYNGHTHIETGSTTDPPDPPMTPATTDILSDNHKVK